MKTILKFVLATFLSLFFALQAQAILITPQYTTFGSLPAATFGGSGIPNNAVAITTYNQALGGTLTLGITAHQRGDNIAVTNNGAGVFTAAIGPDVSTSPVAVANYATWNFGFYVSGIATGQTTTLYFDTDPAAGNNVTGMIPFGNVNGQDSWNLGMNFLGGAAFPESANGVYGLALVTTDGQGLEIARASILVNVGNTNVPDTGNTVTLLAISLVGMGLIHTASRRTKLRLVN